MTNWADIHNDLLVLIARRICLIEDFVAFGSVCQSWRLAATKQNFSNYPCLMLANDDEEQSPYREFYHLSEDNNDNDKNHISMLPEANGKRCFFSQGWLFTIGRDLGVNLLNPLTRSQISLPSLITFPDFDEQIDQQTQIFFIHKVVLSANPSNSSDYVVMVIHNYGSSPAKLAFYKAGDLYWTIVDTCFSMYSDVIYYKHKFYAVDYGGRVLVCDVNGPNPTTAEVVSIIPDGYIDIMEKLYLVELRGKLLLVLREGTYSQPSPDYKTAGFQVFEVDDSNGKWEKVNNIGNMAVFVGDNSTFSFNVHFTPCKPNSIYFTDELFERNYPLPNGGGKDMGVYNIADGSFEPHFKGQSQSRLAPPLWVVPTPF